MRRKKPFLINPIWIGIATIIILLIGIFLDIVLFDPSRRSYLLPKGVMFCFVAGYFVNNAYLWVFWGKLAWRYPEKGADILAVRKLLVIHTKRSKKKLDEMHLNYNNIVVSLLGNMPDHQLIDAEWQTAKKWICFSLASILLTPLLHLFVVNWMEAARPTVLAWLGSIGF